MERSANRTLQVLLGMYSLLLLWLLLARPRSLPDLPYWVNAANHINLVPFRTIRHFLWLLQLPGRRVLHRIALRNLVGNVVLFIPVGWMLPAAFPALGRLWKTLLATALTVCAAEAAQMLLLVGTCDIDDLILNTLGSALGYTLSKAIRFR